ncbi:peptidylprolyl isomerase [Flavobacterium okayamense]|uniref:Peptidyl-prolyl cis-trans isomerase n=1 Tax=Flavobacterium okayamense TaxID=2830782 RepID=A0ABN6HTF4_9FLAO|nr:peptidylprolyl isomerase [Flavobacterium okayamense]BCY27155.1 peptidyl-prolyl cis-trans isomerase [Flavobacterium okayamense]
MKKVVVFLFVLVNSVVSFAQQSEKQVLFTIDNDSFYTDEFTRVYNKNLELVKDDSQKNLNNYLDLFIGYKLKVEKAKKLGLQNNTKYQNELNSYRTQLAKNYLNDSKVTTELVNEAYDRMKTEVRASHILVMVDENADAKDTLKAYNKVLDITKRLKSGEKFEDLALKFSEDPSAKVNKGDLGYFSAFKMVYPFESAAYNTKVGEVSKIVRTRFGYHLIKVTDKRENRGEVTVAHIMLLKPENLDPEKTKEVEKDINDIYQKIQQGESFEELAKQFSDDKSTAAKGGVLQKFGSGQLTSQEFEDVAFGLKEKEQISKPFKSQFGWHIVKLIDKHPLKSLEDLRFDIENNIKRDDRSRLITNSLVNKLSKKYSLDKNAKLYNKIVNTVNDDYYSLNWKQPEGAKNYNETLLTINNDKKVNGSAFLSYLESQQKVGHKTRPISTLVADLYKNWSEEQLISFYNENLEREVPEFRYVMEEYRDGLLLFDLMEKEIWDRAKQDTIGLESFYKSHIDKYKWKDRYDVDIYSSTDKSFVEKAQKYAGKNKSVDYIKEKINKNGKVNVMVKSGLFEKDYDVLPDFDINKEGTTKIVQKGNYYFVANVKSIKSSEPKPLEECKGAVVSDYQQYLEDNWVNDLKKDFTVKVNQEVFNQVKSELTK